MAKSLAAIKHIVRREIIRAGLEVFSSPMLQGLFPRASGRGVIFTLHHVRPVVADGPVLPDALLSVTPAFLQGAIETALASGLTPVHLHELPRLLSDPSDTRNFVCFTLDDGYRDNAEFAAPIFRKYGVPYTIFITQGFVERTRTIWWETAAALVRRVASFEFDFGSGIETVPCATALEKMEAYLRLAGFVEAVNEDTGVQRIGETARRHSIDPTKIVEDLVMDEGELRRLASDPLVHFGAHTIDHVNLRRVGPERLEREMEGSTAAVARYVGAAPLSFSYPYGWKAAAGPREADAAAKAGFAVAVTTQPGVLGASALDRPTALPRVSLNGYYQKRRYVRALISGLPYMLSRGG